MSAATAKPGRLRRSRPGKLGLQIPHLLERMALALEVASQDFRGVVTSECLGIEDQVLVDAQSRAWKACSMLRTCPCVSWR